MRRLRSFLEGRNRGKGGERGFVDCIRSVY